MDIVNQLAKRLDEDTVAVLKAEKVNDRALLLLTDDHLLAMGIRAAGPRIIILSTIEEFKTKSVAHVAREESEEATQQLSREMFESDGYFRNKYLYKILDANLIPDQNGLHALTRIAAKKLSTRIMEGGRYPEIQEMAQLAKQIIILFPLLERTRLHNTAPSESYFFWIHGGKEKGPHTGSVYHHLRNTIRKLPKQMLKFQRPRKISEEFEPISDELYERALVLTRVESTRVNLPHIIDEMAACFCIHKDMLRKEKSSDEILHTFPHLLSFKGLLPTDDTNPLECYVAGQGIDYPHIVCVAPPTKIGPYYIFDGNQLMMQVDSSIIAITTVFRMFRVLGRTVPFQLRFLFEYLACAVFKIQETSTKITVNRMISRFKELQQARFNSVGPSTPQ